MPQNKAVHTVNNIAEFFAAIDAMTVLELNDLVKAFEEKYGVVSLEEFLSEISLVSDVEEYKNNDSVVTLLTVHSAKGLEFKNVFIIGLEEGIFPHKNSFDSTQDMEEERRIFYVACTRAKKLLFFIVPKYTMMRGKNIKSTNSRFINEIDKEFIFKCENKK